MNKNAKLVEKTAEKPTEEKVVPTGKEFSTEQKLEILLKKLYQLEDKIIELEKEIRKSKSKIVL